MVIQEHFDVDGKDFIRTYSDAGMKVHGGFPEGDYDEACDPAEFNRTYTETDIPIDADEEEAEDAEYAQAGRILMGVED